MKCDEMKPLIFSIAELAYVDEIRATKNFQNPHDHAVYKATDVDAAIAELKAENEENDFQRKQLSRLCAIKEKEIKELIDKIQDLKVIMSQKEAAINGLVDKAFNIKKERNLAQRALWFMTAEWADAMGLASCNIANKYISRENFEVSDDYRQKTIQKYRHRQVVFCKYADYCRKKAEVA